MRRSIEQKAAHLNAVLKLYQTAIVSTNGKKNCSQMASENEMSHDELQRAQTFLSKNLGHLRPLLLGVGIALSRQKRGCLIADITHIIKAHSKKIEGAGKGYSGSKNKIENGLSLITIMWTDGKIKVPLAYEIFVPEAISGDNHVEAYKIALKLVIPIAYKLGCFTFLADGAFANEIMMKGLSDEKISYVMRFASNRKAEIDGIEAQLRKHPVFKFDRNQRAISVQAHWHGMQIFITASRQRNKRSRWEYRYLVSNRSNEKLPHITTYDKRWAIEVFFRSAKQDFGLSDCQARSLDKQKAHIAAVFFVFIESEIGKAENDSRMHKTSRNRKISHPALTKVRSAPMEHAYA